MVAIPQSFPCEAIFLNPVYVVSRMFWRGLPSSVHFRNDFVVVHGYTGDNGVSLGRDVSAPSPFLSYWLQFSFFGMVYSSSVSVQP